jgi:cellulose synthase/poly-beta-1,6-N-acetylglucosamine synthase-like glycosyltransferase
MGGLWDSVAWALADAGDYVRFQIAHRDGWDWLLLLTPLFLFGELPRYGLPAMLMPILNACGLPRRDRAAERRFLATRPSVSVLLVGYNEEDSVAKAIRSLLELPWPGLEIIVVDDGSKDRMYAVAKPFAEAGLIKLWRNSAATGRQGRPSSSNLALHLSTGEFIISVDADTSFDVDTVERMIAPFHDARVGAVAGNLMPGNTETGMVARLQAAEYLVSIGLWKRWLDCFGMYLQASGAFGAFRRSALLQVGGWDPELAEDADLTIKVRRSGWKVVFAPFAVALTNVPPTWKILINQRVRWDKGTLRTYYRKHRSVMDPRRFDPRIAWELANDFLFSIACPFIYLAWILILAWQDQALALFALGVGYVVYFAMAVLTTTSGAWFSKRFPTDFRLLALTPAIPLYRELLRWVRIYAIVLETFHLNYDEGYLPPSAWRNTPRW